MRKISFLILMIILSVFLYLSIFIVPKGMIYCIESRLRGKEVYKERSVIFFPEVLLGFVEIVKVPEFVNISEKIILKLPYIEDIFVSEHYKVEVFYSAKIDFKRFSTTLYVKNDKEIIEDIKENILARIKEILVKNSYNLNFSQLEFLSEIAKINSEGIEIDFKVLYFPEWNSYVSIVKSINKWFENDSKNVIIEGIEKMYRAKIDAKNNLETFDTYFKKSEETLKKILESKYDYKTVFEIMKFLYKEGK